MHLTACAVDKGTLLIFNQNIFLCPYIFPYPTQGVLFADFGALISDRTVSRINLLYGK